MGEKSLMTVKLGDLFNQSIQPIVKRILPEWRIENPHRHYKKRSETFEIYSGGKNLFFLFLHSIPTEMQKVNKLFESMSVDTVDLLNNLILRFLKTIDNR